MYKSPMRWLLFAAVLGLAACASIGRPQGGEKDKVPPKFVTSKPAPFEKNVDRQKLEFVFDENIQLEDAFNKVIVSPVQKNTPAVSSNGRKITVELKDSLLPNTTYTIDFGDAIKDLNEGNILDGFAAAFSTGDSIDTLRISGMVLEARNLEPAQGMLVGVYSNLADTAISTLPLERIARTNQLGQFTIHNLKPGNYRIFALNDINRDYHWDRSEDVAFYDVTVSPYAEPIMVTDTLRAHDDSDSLVQRAGTAYFPNDVLLSWFNEDYKSQYLKDHKRPERRIISLEMAAPSDSLPDITIANGTQAGRNIRDWAVLQANPTLDTLQYWIRDTTVLAIDSLLLSVKYLRTDTTDMLSWTTDTIKFFYKEPKSKSKEKEKPKKKDEEADSVAPKIDFMNFQAATSKSQEYHLPVVLKSEVPIDTLIAEGVHLEMKEDTLWLPVDGAVLVPDSISPLTKRLLHMKWNAGQAYRLTVDSASVYDIYGLWNNKFVHEFTVKNLDEYANLFFNVTGLDSIPAVVELLNNSDKLMATAPVIDGKASFRYVKPGVVYARLFLDTNGNGIWDTGKLLDSIQPEEVYYYPKKINLRKNWDVTQDWNIYELALDLQKPYEIKKNKPKLKSGERAPGRNDDDEDEEEDEFGTPFGGNGYGSGNNSNYGYGNNNANSRNPYANPRGMGR